MIIIVMGVSGAGKTTVGQRLAKQLGWRFIEGDNYHPADNKAKMAAAIPLNDEDRQPWLERLTRLIDRHLQIDRPAVVSCSALKQRYREQLVRDSSKVRLVFLQGSYELIMERFKHRTNHFMRPDLLQSQFDDLQIPDEALTIPIDQSSESVASRIKKAFCLTPSPIETQLLLEGLMFPEAPRWRDGWLWFTDQHAQRVMRVNPEGESEILATLDDLPGGLGWLPDGRLLVVSMTKRQILVLQGSTLHSYADLSSLASFHCNDMLVDSQGRSYVGNFGFDLHGGATQRPAELILVERNGHAMIAAEELLFPNGCALSRDRRTLLVAETFASRISSFQVETDGRLTGRRIWADLGDAFPDGICLDAQANLWVAAPNRSQLLLIKEGGEILRTVRPIGDPYACMIGGEQNDQLFITTAETDDPFEARQLQSGRIEQLKL